MSREKLHRMLLSRPSIASTLPIALSLALTILSSNTNNNSDEDIFSTITPTEASSPLDYLSNIRHFSIFFEDILTLPYWTHSELLKELPQQLMEYLVSDEFDQIYRSNPFRPEMVTSYFESKPKEVVLYHYYLFKVNQETHWCLSHPILEQLQSFTILYMSTIKDYIKVVGRFRNLEKIRFDISDWFEGSLSSSEDRDYSRNDSDTKGTHNEEVIKDMFQFVQEHIRLFPGCLKTVTCFDHNASRWHNEEWELASRIQQDLYRLLPPLHEPTCLRKENWAQFLAHHHSIDLSHVQELDDYHFPESWYEDSTHNGRPILQRCRYMKHLRLQTLNGMFEWAVQEKKDMESIGRGITTGGCTPRHSGQRRALVNQKETLGTHALVPIESVVVTEPYTGIEGINNVAIAFSQTLAHLSASTIVYSNPILLGHGWVDLPALTYLNLSLSLNSGRLELDPLLFDRCPNLKLLHLVDSTQRHSCDDIVVRPPFVQLKHIEHLHLHGWTALTFDPSTLLSTTKLNYLSISVHATEVNENDDYYHENFIPPVEELYRSYGIKTEQQATATRMDLVPPEGIRPRWTWDWDLPLLTSLRLTAEFALLFEFRMLLGCPSLESLYLDIRLTTDHRRESVPLPSQTRTISESDLLMPPSSSTATLQADKRIFLPFLTQLELHGAWAIDKSAVSRLFSTDIGEGMFPGVKEIYMFQWLLPTLDCLLCHFRSAAAAAANDTTNTSTESVGRSGVHFQISDPCCKQMEQLGIYISKDRDRTRNYDISGEDNSDDEAVAGLRITSYHRHVFAFLPEHPSYSS
ncbi:hypothetical protein BGZ97_007572 [Linnemannia gamsii]|jgi:hypothetical protein|uniref:F-box domain-containing protein n=1 Tax=Linnemannia gamsii TaxID=64522 RepID=A0A9P6RAR2_9FUNG|nr:hypothetical protein BGZ97_007572 [Linnemannia gamsii]